MSTAPDCKPSLAWIARLRLWLLAKRSLLAVGCWVAGTSVAELRRIRRLQELTGRCGQ
jgi:hypothetical protein